MNTYKFTKQDDGSYDCIFFDDDSYCSPKMNFTKEQAFSFIGPLIVKLGDCITISFNF